VALTVFVAVLMTETVVPVPAPKLIAKALVPSGVMAIARAEVPTATVALTVLVAVLMTETLLEPLLAT
jgi:hypothetical protein